MAEENADTALVPIEERAIEFYEDDVVAVAVEENGERRIYVPIKPLSDHLGLSWSGQYERIMRDEVLSEVAHLIRVTRIKSSRGNPETLALPIEFLNGWLFGVSLGRIKDDVMKEKIKRYQKECYRVLYEAFRSDRPDTIEAVSETMMRAMRDNALQQARIWETLLSEQRRLRATEELVQEHEEMIWEAFDQLGTLRQEQSRLIARFDDVTRLLPLLSDTISPAQKAAIKSLVDDIVAAAQERRIRLGQGRNDYPAVWGAFKQRFDLARYDELTVAQYEEALAWLKGWLDRVRGG